jgi:hypothetical protein
MGYSLGRRELFRPCFYGTQGFVAVLTASSTLSSVVSYTEATERRHMNGGNDSIRDFPLSMTINSALSLSAPFIQGYQYSCEQNGKTIWRVI